MAIYLGMMVKDASMREIFKKNFNSQEKISAISLKFLNMMGWLIRTLLRNGADLPLLLRNLGSMHGTFGVNIKHFEPMLESMHESFSHYFPNIYGVKVCLLLLLFIISEWSDHFCTSLYINNLSIYCIVSFVYVINKYIGKVCN